MSSGRRPVIRRDTLADVAAGAAALAASAAGVRELQKVPAWMLQDDLGATRIPQLVLVAMAVLGALVVLQAVVRMVRAGREPGLVPGTQPAPVVSPVQRAAAIGRWSLQLLMVFSLAGYLWAVRRLGFLAATFVFLLLWITVLRYQQPARVAAVQALVKGSWQAAVLALAVWVTFRYFVRVPLP